MAKGKNLVELVSSITGKGTSMTARSFGRIVNNLETKIKRLEAKDKLTARYWACKTLWAGKGGSKKSSPKSVRGKY